MNKIVLNISRIYFLKVKNELLLSLIISVFTLMCIKSNQINEAIQIFILIIAGITIFKIQRSINLIANNNNLDSFNWKYIINLPLNAQDKILTVILFNFISAIPYLIFFIFNIDRINYFIDGSYIINYPLFILDLILLLIIFSIMSLKSAIVFPRSSMQKFTSNQVLIRNLYLAVKYIAIAFGSILAATLLIEYNIIQAKTFENLVMYLLKSILNWFNIIYLTLLILYHFKDTLKVLTNEVSSYIPSKDFKIKNNLLKLAGIITFAFSFYHFFYFELFVDSSDFAQMNNQVEMKNFLNAKSKYLNKAVSTSDFTLTDSIIHSGNLKLLIEAENYGAKLNHIILKEKNHIGYNALYLAIDSNKLDMIKYILNKGFDLNFKTEKAEIYPIHVAIEECNPEVINFLASNNLNLNVLFKNKENLFIYSIKKNCIYGAIWSFQNGIDINQTDTDGKDWRTILNNNKKIKNNDKATLELALKAN